MKIIIERKGIGIKEILNYKEFNDMQEAHDCLFDFLVTGFGSVDECMEFIVDNYNFVEVENE